MAADRTVDERFRVVVDGPIGLMAVGHGRVYSVRTHGQRLRPRGAALMDAAARRIGLAAGIAVGSAPGLSDLAWLDVPAFAMSLSAPAPPGTPGTYHVRLVAGCFTPTSSNEVMVVVP